MSLARANSEKFGIRRVTCLLAPNYFPVSSGILREMFEDAFPADEYDALVMDVGDWAARALKEPPHEECILCIDLYSQVVSTILGGITGYDYLAPTCFVGEEHKLFLPVRRPDYGDVEKDLINPTSAIQAVASILRLKGLGKEAAAVMDSLTDAYLNNRRTPDLGGSLTTEQFTDVIIENIQSRLA